ncbi:hypothetical protein F2Q68_00045472 [Brassica cretica]|uniref:Protein kinase domain-containing protein n=1 Tax=Brassica cretica TaxID=69181 RepID=A0A8S9LLF8_BRACR|nr:hypothetical protein F2Q68_00045472 [Brassica cretica]
MLRASFVELANCRVTDIASIIYCGCTMDIFLIVVMMLGRRSQVPLEKLLTGLRTLDPTRPSAQQNLVEWAKPALTQKKKIQKMMDPRLEHKYPIMAVTRTAALILRCLEADPKNRPPMDDVLRELEIVRTIRDEERRKRSSGGSDNNRVNGYGSPHVRRTGRTR